MKSIAGLTGQVFAWLVILVMLGILAVCVAIPRLGGGTPYTILTGSMRSTLPEGTLVVVKPTPIDQIEIGDIITFQIASSQPEVATHRVIGRTTASDGAPRLLTKGDDNPVRDNETVRAEQIRGKLWYSAPVVGRANILLDKSQHQGIAGAVTTGLVLYAAFMLVAAAKERALRTNQARVEIPA